VYYGYRVGALRFKLTADGFWLNNNGGQIASPVMQLRVVEQASLALDADVDYEAEIDDGSRVDLTGVNRRHQY